MTYIGNIPIPQAVMNKQIFTATNNQTNFATSGYTPGFIDVFLNGVKLVIEEDYTATNGSDVILLSGTASGDILETVAYRNFETHNQNFTGNISMENLSIENNLNMNGELIIGSYKIVYNSIDDSLDFVRVD